MKRLTLAFIAALSPGLATPVHGDTQVLEDPLVRGVVFPEVTTDDALGVSVAGVGDFNGDGIDDFAIGAAPAFDRSPSAVYLVFGRRDFTSVVNLARTDGRIRIATDDRGFGIDVAGAGDVDRDGLADLWILQNYGRATDPRLYLLYASRDLPAELTVDEIGTAYRGAVFSGSTLPTYTFNKPLAALKDFNGDAVPDLAIGNGFGGESGLVTVLFGSGAFGGALDLDALVDAGGGVLIIGSMSSGNDHGFGFPVSAAGDVNGDGLSDLVVADPIFRNEGQQTPAGRVYLIYGSRSFPRLLEVDKLGSLGVTVESPSPFDGSGVADVFGGGDLDGDGLAEFGFSQFEGSPAMGRILVLRGGKQLPPIIGIPQIEDGSRGFELRPQSLTDRGGFGGEVRLVPAEDGDGRPELFVGTQGGREVLVLRGQYPMTAEAVEHPLHRFEQAAGMREFVDPGAVFSSAGDVNADGIPDYVIGASDFFTFGADGFRSNVFLVFGGFETQLLSVSAVSPAKAPIGQSVEVTISGTGFAQGVQVLFGDTAAPSVRLVDPRTLIVSTPLVAAPGTVDVVVVHPDGRRATLTAAFTFVAEDRKLSLADLPGVVTFEPSHSIANSSYIRPEVLGDVNGDGVEDYVLRAVEGHRERGFTHLIYGGKAWSGVVHDEPLNAASVRFTSIGATPLGAPVGDLNGDGRSDFAMWDFRGGQFAVVFEAPPEGTEVALQDLRGDPRAAFFSGPGNDLSLQFLNRGADFDGDGEQDLVARVFKGVVPPAIAILRGPIRPGEVVELQYGDGRIIRIVDAQNPDFMGEMVTFAGDFNGDGRPDLAYHDRERDAVVLVFGHRPASDLLDIADLERDGLALRLSYPRNAFESASLAAAGDVNGDGVGDVLIKALTPTDDNFGAAAVLLGRKEFPAGAEWKDLLPAGGFVLHGTVDGQSFGGDADLRGDLDGKGRPDLVVGASHLATVVDNPKGQVFIAHDVDDLRGDFKITDVPRVVTTIEGEVPLDRFGYTVRVLGDQDGDGIPELLVEAPYLFAGTGPFRGKTFLIPGGSLFPPRPAGFRRGDVDANGTAEITDAVQLLGFLFLGEAGPACQDAADADDTGRLDINDPVFILGYLFQGGLEPPAPGPTNCGSDPTADGLPECLPAC